MANNSDLRAIFDSLLIVLESQQRQLDELLERQLSTEDVAKTKWKDFAEVREDAAARLSNATQYPLAEKADKFAELRALIHSRIP